MDWQLRLITLYEAICKHYQEQLWVYCQRFSPYVDLGFSDEEVLCIYLWGLMDKRRELRTIYDDTRRHLHAWFPRLPSYGGFVQRLNQLADVFVPLLEALQAQCPQTGVLRQVRLLDSMPIRLAHGKRSNRACVAAELARLLCFQGRVRLRSQGPHLGLAPARDITLARIHRAYTGQRA